jgi:hypothetical protein
MTTIVEFNKPKRRRPSARELALPLDQATGAGRFLNKMVRNIETDLGGRRQLSRMEGELIQAFAGAATTLRYLNVQVALGETGEIDLSGYATIASTMLRIGSKLGLKRHEPKRPTLGDVLVADFQRQQQEEFEAKQAAARSRPPDEEQSNAP